MSYPDKETDRLLNELVGDIQTVYDDAESEVMKKASDYFASYKKRWEKEYQAYQEGKYTKEEFHNWELAQMGRGKRWEKIRDDAAQRLSDANSVAKSYINDATPGIYSLNANYTAFEIESATGIAFDIYDEQTVKRLMTGETKILSRKAVQSLASMEWHQKQLTVALTSAIIQGKDIGSIATAFQRVSDMDRVSALRNARTSVTTAENSGRQAGYEQAAKLGINMKKEWIATEDERTRESHAELDGVQVEYNEKFPNDLMFPGDQDGDPSEFYNCRCTTRAIIGKYNGGQRASEVPLHEGNHNKDTYKRWLEAKMMAKMLNSKPTTHADATHRAQQRREDAWDDAQEIKRRRKR